jgi:hypothetical protein
VSDPSGVRFVETLPQPASGPPLQRAILGGGHHLAEEFRFLASKVVALGTNRFTTIGIVSAGPGRARPRWRSDSRRPRQYLAAPGAPLEADLPAAIRRYLSLPRTAGWRVLGARPPHSRAHRLPARLLGRLGEASAWPPGALAAAHGGAHRRLQALDFVVWTARR